MTESRFCMAHQVADENETCPCCEAVHQADLLGQLRQDLQALPRYNVCVGLVTAEASRDGAWISAADLAAVLTPREPPA